MGIFKNLTSGLKKVATIATAAVAISAGTVAVQSSAAPETIRAEAHHTCNPHIHDHCVSSRENPSNYRRFCIKLSKNWWGCNPFKIRQDSYIDNSGQEVRVTVSPHNSRRNTALPVFNHNYNLNSRVYKVEQTRPNNIQPIRSQQRQLARVNVTDRPIPYQRQNTQRVRRKPVINSSNRNVFRVEKVVPQNGLYWGENDRPKAQRNIASYTPPNYAEIAQVEVDQFHKPLNIGPNYRWRVPRNPNSAYNREGCEYISNSVKICSTKKKIIEYRNDGGGWYRYLTRPRI
ncbi:MAG: hypothetical protein AAGF07_02790 [Patescibacteria group bacterium]